MTTKKTTTPAPTPTTDVPSEHPTDLVEVIDNVTGDRSIVGRAWLDRWPNDFRLATEPAPAGTPEPTPAQDNTGSVAEPDPSQEQK